MARFDLTDAAMFGCKCLAAAEGLTPVDRILHSATKRIFPCIVSFAILYI